MEGVERVITAYTGGKKESPKHHKPYDHSEALFIEFNPTLISYSQILEVWHECDNPWEEQIQQYRSAVFWKALSQQDTTLQFIEELKANNPKKKLYTDVEPVRKVYEAEVYESEGSDVGESPRNGKKALAQPSPRNRKKSAALQSGQKL
jgi:peptide methionine sulfoxide reductase MsrA